MHKSKKAAFQGRADEAKVIIERLMGTMTLDEIASRASVSSRSVHRWLKEGRAPHPLILDTLRRMSGE